MLNVITFRLGRELFSVNVKNVREIRGRMAISPLAHAPRHVIGIIELRGQVIPVIDVGRRLGLTDAAPGAEGAVIIVTECQGKMTGLLVQDVTDMLTVDEANIKPVPATCDGPIDPSLSSILVFDTHLITHLDLAGLVGGSQALAA
ncbi:chemotaxis protein CheW [Zhengella mangrovi]|uniref:Chemotaxis protein CheW n=1 Tax=Zhengella mangrovi TaxID=1982044 RepID=A0A2G1QN88_9HYPH|nr:chemotaxis protein CheW [Zhengella mangrovi]PHP66678.1 chemotaxis protein CheW [Zhengella mangrovi]